MGSLFSQPTAVPAPVDTVDETMQIDLGRRAKPAGAAAVAGSGTTLTPAEKVLNSAVDTLEAAVALDRAGKAQAAFDKYNDALTMVFPILGGASVMPPRGWYHQCFSVVVSLLGTPPADLPVSRQAEVRGTIETYLSRAEELKATLRQTAGGAWTPVTGAPAPVPSTHAAPRPVVSAAKPAPRPTASAGATAAAAAAASSSRPAAGLGVKRPLAAPAQPPAAGRPAPPGASHAGSRELSALEAEILEEVLSPATGVTWDDIAGLAFAKQQLVRESRGCPVVGGAGALACRRRLRLPLLLARLPSLASMR